MIMIQNSMEQEIYYKKNGRIRTGKGDEKNHGIGLSNVEDAVIRNGGRFGVYTGRKSVPMCGKISK